MSTDENKITSDDQLRGADKIIAAALATGCSYPEAGAEAKVSGKTVQRRMADPKFAAEVRRRRDEQVARTTNKLTGLEEEAVEALRELLSAERPADRLRAVQLILSMGHKRRETDDLVRRLEELEREVQTDPTPAKEW